MSAQPLVLVVLAGLPGTGKSTLLSVVTAAAVLLGAWLGYREGNFAALWLTPDQQGVRAMRQLEFSVAADLFEDPDEQAAFEATLHSLVVDQPIMEF